MAIDVTIENRIGRIALARPEVRNALNDEVMRKLAEALDSFEANDQVRVVVITGIGKTFSAGADLAFMQRIASAGAEANKADALELGKLFHRVATFAKPVVARVNGPAIGGGVGLVAACDIVVAADTAFFAFSEVRLGLVPAVISPFCIRRLGAARARRLFLTGERFSAAVALEYGLADRIVANESLDAAVDAVCDDLVRGAPNALAEAKRLIDDVSTLPRESVLSYTAECIARLRSGDEAKEGMQAFLEKRAPSWAPDDS